MDPERIEHQPSSELPMPQIKGETAEVGKPTSPERVSSAEAGKQAPSMPGGHPPISPVLGGLPPASAPPTAATSAPTSGAANPAIADDVDVIEKEWVEKAKAIVARTKHDPHQQNKEMTKFKADYLKKRYNKELKVGEE